MTENGDDSFEHCTYYREIKPIQEKSVFFSPCVFRTEEEHCTTLLQKYFIYQILKK